jgi:hypothetical protein
VPDAADDDLVIAAWQCVLHRSRSSAADTPAAAAGPGAVSVVMDYLQ